MPKVTESEYPALKAFFFAWLDQPSIREFLTADTHPAKGIEKMEALSMRRAREGLGMAINDILEMSMHLSPAEVSALDSDLQSRGVITLSELRVRYSRHFRTVMKRGRIKNEEEYYLMAGIMASGTDRLSETEIVRLDAMLMEFPENNQSENKDKA